MVDERASRVRSERAPQAARDSSRSGRAVKARDDVPVAQARAEVTREAKEVRRTQPPRRDSAGQRAKQVSRPPPRETAEDTSPTVDEAADDFSVRWHRAGE
jgi:hypothetical protein